MSLSLSLVALLSLSTAARERFSFLCIMYVLTYFQLCVHTHACKRPEVSLWCHSFLRPPSTLVVEACPTPTESARLADPEASESYLPVSTSPAWNHKCVPFPPGLGVTSGPHAWMTSSFVDRPTSSASRRRCKTIWAHHFPVHSL